jgi:succinylglutamate desuccinylase
VRGEFVGLAGNRAALRAGQRFVDRDLNRAWTDARLERLREAGWEGTDAEDVEQVELLGEIERVAAAARGPVYALDLHTTSGPGGIFSAFGDALPHRTFAGHFPVPMILGLEELVEGTLLNFLGEHGLISVTVETGQHQEPAAVDRAQAAIWIALEDSGVVSTGLLPEVSEGRKLLYRSSTHLPRALEMRYRHPVEDGDGFVMNPGRRNFQRVSEGQILASDRGGKISANERARLLMPLYQKQGEDGFFLVREFSRFWLHVSYVMRRMGLDRAAPLLPGVRRVPGSSDAVIVHKRIARFFAKQLFHLLGFRQMEDAGSSLVMRRRPFDRNRLLSARLGPDQRD